MFVFLCVKVHILSGSTIFIACQLIKDESNYFVCNVGTASLLILRREVSMIRKRKRYSVKSRTHRQERRRRRNLVQLFRWRLRPHPIDPKPRPLRLRAKRILTVALLIMNLTWRCSSSSSLVGVACIINIY